MAQSANFKQNYNELLTLKTNNEKKKHSTELRSKGYGREYGFHTETMAVIIPGSLQTKTQDRYRTIVKRRRSYRHRLNRKKKQNILEDFIWVMGPEPLFQITKADYKTEPDRKK